MHYLCFSSFQLYPDAHRQTLRISATVRLVFHCIIGLVSQLDQYYIASWQYYLLVKVTLPRSSKLTTGTRWSEFWWRGKSLIWNKPMMTTLRCLWLPLSWVSTCCVCHERPHKSNCCYVRVTLRLLRVVGYHLIVHTLARHGASIHTTSRSHHMNALMMAAEKVLWIRFCGATLNVRYAL